MRPPAEIFSEIRVKVLPRSSGNRLAGTENGVLRVKLTAPPVDGKANAALRAFLSDLLGCPRGAVEIVAGSHARLKNVRIYGFAARDLERVLARLERES